MKASAAGVETEAVSAPETTTRCTTSARSGSANGTRPCVTASTVAALTSTPWTRTPVSARAAAVGRPM